MAAFLFSKKLIPYVFSTKGPHSNNIRQNFVYYYRGDGFDEKARQKRKEKFKKRAFGRL